jgi:dienelactone hydrolase
VKYIWIAVLLNVCLLFSCYQKNTLTIGSQGEREIFTLPEVSGPLTIDGNAIDEIWTESLSFPLVNNEPGYPGKGGVTFIAVRGSYLCLGAKIPESGRLIVRSTGINPSWWREDMIMWKIRYRSPGAGGNRVLIFAVNPFGAFSAGWVRDIYNISRNDIFTTTPPAWAGEILAAAVIEKDGWMVEAALPLEHIDTIGFISVERIRAPGVNVPELNWYWPAQDEQAAFRLTVGAEMPTPELQRPEIPKNEIISKAAKANGHLASEIAALPGILRQEGEIAQPDVRRMLETSVRSRIAKQAEAEKKEWQKVNTIRDWNLFRDKRLKALNLFIGTFPERTPLNAEINARIDPGDGFVIENIIFESRPGLFVAANLYLPEKYSRRVPAIVVVHSHHASKTQSELQDMGMTWARAGTAVLVMDQLCAGERVQTQPWSRESYYGRYNLGNQLYLAGESLIKWMAWDIIRGIDLLTERSFIDAQRIVLLGAVAGGGDPAALAAVLDQRIAAVIPFNFGEAGPEEHYTEGPRPYDFETADPGWAFWETTRNMPKSVSEQYFPWFICAAMAPRNFIYSFEVGWPKTVEEEPAWSRYKKVYELYGEGNHLASVDGYGPFPGPGECTNVGTYLRGRIYPILSDWFGIPVPEAEYHQPLHESALMCLTPAIATKRSFKPAALIALGIAEKRLKNSENKRSALPPGERANSLCQDLAEKMGVIEPVTDPLTKKIWSRQFSDFNTEEFYIGMDSDIFLPVILLTPKDNSVPHPAVIALAEGGKERFLSRRSDEIAVLLNEGMAVCLPDLRGIGGELAGSSSRGPGAMSLAANELMLGGTLTGSRLKDARTIFRWLGKQPGIDLENISLWGDSFSEPNSPDFEFHQSPGQQAGTVRQRQAEPLGPFIALLTALYEKSVSAVACRGGLISFTSALEDNFCHLPQDIIVPGLLEVADVREIIRTLVPRPILFAEPVDGLNKKVSPTVMQNIPDNAESNLTIIDNADNQLLALWLKDQCLKKSDRKKNKK